MKSFVCLVMLAFSGLAQTFQPGSSLDDVYVSFGVPAKWWLPEPRRYLNSFQEALAAVGDGVAIQDVYERKTATNAYEIRLIRRVDNRESPRPSKIRLAGLEFLVSKPAPFRKILPDIAEARSLCTGGCNLYGLDDTTRFSILVYPINPFPGETEEATAAAYGYAPDFKPSHAYDWVLKLNFKKRDLLLEIHFPSRPDWTNGRIENVQILPACLDFELRKWSGHAKPHLLGPWNP